MKTLLLALAALGLPATIVLPAERPKDEPLVWCGLDYSKVKMIGTLDFRRPDEIFPGMLVQWNGLFMKEMLPKLESIAKTVRTDMTAVSDRNSRTTPAQIERKDGSRDEMVKASHLTDDDIAGIVRSYRLEQKNVLGLVFIMDRLVKNQAEGCMYVVFFDVNSRRIVRSERICGAAGGAGFRNYWFRPVKIAVEELPKMYTQAKKGQ